MPSIARDGADLWVDARGRGAAVLLVHGGLFDPMDGARFWIAPGVADDLAAAGYRALTPDRRYGAGRTSCDFGAHGWEIEADDLAAVLDAAPAHVVAGSNGCSAALRLALRRPESVRSLTVCWPATPANAALEADFVRSAARLEAIGPAAYLAELRANGLPRPGEARPGFPYGAALLRDARLAASFRATPPSAAAAVLRATAAALLPGELVRGFDAADATRLGQRASRVTIIPAAPEDAYHRRATAERLAAALPGARVTDGVTLSPAPGFAAARGRFGALLAAAFARAEDAEPFPVS